MSTIKVGALQNLSGTTEFDLINGNILNVNNANIGTAVTTTNITATNVTTTNVNGANPNRLVLGTAQNSTSGTAIDFTGIPSWAKRITVMLNSVSTNGSSNPIIQIGSGSIQTTGYASNGSNQAGNVTATISNGFLFSVNTVAASSISGISTIILLGSNVYVQSSLVASIDATGALRTAAGNVTLSGTLDRVRITTVNGTDTFDAGSVNILYEG